MDFGNNIEIYRRKLIEITNNSNLSIGTAYYVFKDVFRELEGIYLQSLKDEISSSEKEEKETIMFDEQTEEKTQEAE